MFNLLFFLFLIFVIYYCISNKIKIKWKTFFKKGFKVKKGTFGIYVYVGVQGNGKSYSCAEYVIDNYEDSQIFSNITFTNPAIHYIHYSGFKELLQLRDAIDYARERGNDFIIFKGKKHLVDFEKQIVFIYDEIFSELQRGSKISTDVLDFITQMRKRHFILLTTAQIWSDIPITWRRLTRYQIDCRIISIIFTSILIKVFHDAEQMKWSNDDQEFIAPIISTTITHTRKIVSNSYDTFEVIHNKNSNYSSNNSSLSNIISSKELQFSFDENNNKTEFDEEFWEEKQGELIDEEEK